MPVTFRFVLNHDGVAELLKSQPVLDEMTRRAQNIADTAQAAVDNPEGEDMQVESIIGENRARASVFTATVPAMLAEAHQQALTRAIDSGRA